MNIGLEWGIDNGLEAISLKKIGGAIYHTVAPIVAPKTYAEVEAAKKKLEAAEKALKGKEPEIVVPAVVVEEKKILGLPPAVVYVGGAVIGLPLVYFLVSGIARARKRK